MLQLDTANGPWLLMDGATFDEAGPHIPIPWFPSSQLSIQDVRNYCKVFDTEEDAQSYLVTAALVGKTTEHVKIVCVDG